MVLFTEGETAKSMRLYALSRNCARVFPMEREYLWTDLQPNSMHKL